MCLAQGHNAVMQFRIKPGAPQFRVKHSTTTQLTERNIWVKLNENQSKGSGDMSRQNSRVNPMTLNCDLESA